MNQYLTQLQEKSRDGFIQIPHWMQDISKLYSVERPKGVKFSAAMQKLYCYLEGWQRSGKDCYETVKTFMKITNLQSEATVKLLDDLEKLNLLIKTPRKNGFIYKVIPLNDSHLFPPGKLPVQEEKAPPLEVVQVEKKEDPQQRLINFMDWDFFIQNARSSHDNLSGYLSAIVQREEGREDTQEINDFTRWYIQYKRDAAKERVDYLKNKADAF